MYVCVYTLVTEYMRLHCCLDALVQGLATYCVRNTWPTRSWVLPGQGGTGGMNFQETGLRPMFEEKLKGIQLNQSVGFVAFDADKPKSQRKCWFNTRRGKASGDCMWAGRILGIYRHKSPLEFGQFV